MRVRIFLTFIGGLLIFSPAVVIAHTSDSGMGSVGGLVHVLTGEHLLMLVLVGICAVCIAGLHRRFR